MPSLPDNPEGTDLEHLVAAHFVSRGCFVESGVTERLPEDVSDIDVVWTDYREHPATARPVEVKGKNWELEDLFKFFGWTQYLGLEPGQFAYVREPQRFMRTKRVASRMGVELLRVDRENVEESFAGLALPEPTREFLPNLWRFSYWARSRSSLRQHYI